MFIFRCSVCGDLKRKKERYLIYDFKEQTGLKRFKRPSIFLCTLGMDLDDHKKEKTVFCTATEKGWSAPRHKRRFPAFKYSVWIKSVL